MPRRYSEEEAQRIFALVAERQRTVSGTDGLTLDELEEAAQAAGLDPGLVAVAAAELDAAPHEARTLLGAPVEVVRTRVIDGPVSDDTWAGLVAQARREFGQPGMAGQVGRLREWTLIENTSNNDTVTRLTAEPAADGTRITVSKSVRDVVFGLTLASAIQWALATIFGVLAVAGVEADLWIPALFLAFLGTGLGAGAQIGARVWQRAAAGRFEALLDRLELIARDAPPAAPLPEASSEPESVGPRLSLDALGDAPDADAARADPTRTRA